MSSVREISFIMFCYDCQSRCTVVFAMNNIRTVSWIEISVPLHTFFSGSSSLI